MITGSPAYRIGIIKLRKPMSDEVTYRVFHRSATSFLITLEPEDGYTFLYGTLVALDFNKIYDARKHEETYECP